MVGPCVRHHNELSDVMDEWIGDENLWVRRTAIIHQLKSGPNTDEQQLYRYQRLEILQGPVSLTWNDFIN